VHPIATKMNATQQQKLQIPSTFELSQRLGEPLDFKQTENENSLIEAYRVIESQQRKIEQLETHLKEAAEEKEKILQLIQGKEKELVFANNTRIQLETKILQLQTELEEARIHHEKENAIRQSQLNREIDKVENLKQQLNEKTQEVERTKRTLRELEEKFHISKTTLESKVFDLEREKERLLEQLRNRETLPGTEAEQKCAYLENHIKLQEKQIETLQKEVTHYKKRHFGAMESISKVERLEQQLAQSQNLISQLQETLSTYKDYETILPKLRAEALQNAENEKKIRNLQKENESLQERLQNVEVLKEEILSLKQQIENKDKQLSHYIKLKVEYETLAKYKSEWESVLMNLQSFPSVENVKNTISALKKENISLIESKGKLETELKVLQNALNERDEKIKNLKEKVKQFQQLTREAQETQTQQEKYLQLVIRERDGLKSLLQSYDLEDKLYSHDKQKDARIEELERLMAEKNNLIEQYNNEIKKLQEMKFQLEKQIDRDNKEIEQLSERVRVLEQRLGKGEYDPHTTRVLHFKDNPKAIAKRRKRDKEIQKLKQEVKELRRQNELLKSATESDSVQAILNELEKTKEELKKTKEQYNKLHQRFNEAEIQFKEGEIRMQRLQEVCTKKIQEFKEACQSLFGYKIDFDDNLGKRYRLLSIYAEKETDFLLFHWSSKTKSMSLLETEFSKTLLPQMSQFLKGNSIPAFLSDLTLRLFAKTRQQ
jgi:mitotic spindle assembly checkpoint protein MAD1